MKNNLFYSQIFSTYFTLFTLKIVKSHLKVDALQEHRMLRYLPHNNHSYGLVVHISTRIISLRGDDHSL